MPEEFYRNEFCYAVVGDEPATLGHVRIYPTKEATSLEELDEEFVITMMKVANACAKVLFERLQAKGTSILCHNGSPDRLHVQVIPRFENDGMILYPQGKQGDRAMITKIGKEIADKLVLEDPPPPKVYDDSRSEEKGDITDQRLLHYFRRSP